MPWTSSSRAGRLAHEHQIGARIADAEHHLTAAQPVQLAARAVADLAANGLQGLLRGSDEHHGHSRVRRGRGLSRHEVLHGARRDLRRRGTTPPARVEADASDAKFLKKSEVFREVSVVHERT